MIKIIKCHLCDASSVSQYVQPPQDPHLQLQRRVGAEHLPLQLEHDLLLPRLQHEGREGALYFLPHRHHR
jgi:hypothetical protein